MKDSSQERSLRKLLMKLIQRNEVVLDWLADTRSRIAVLRSG